MLALYRAGRQAEALGVYHDARRALVDELGIEPSPALQQLYRSMLRQEAVLESVPLPSRAPEDQLGEVVKALLAGRLVIVVGAGVNAGVANGDGLPGRGRGRRPPCQVLRLSARVRAAIWRMSPST